jgi:hypothetical protein
MNKLEKHIRTNREQLDSFEPSSNHMTRFREKLNPARLSLYKRIPYGFKIAVILLLVAITSILVFEQSQKYYISRQQPLEKIIPGEYKEARIYYTSQIKQKHTEIDQLNLSDPERNELVFMELKEMDHLFQSLLRDLQTNPSDERVLSAMINHYQMKLEIMGQIIEQLEKANKINSKLKSHEKSEV